MEISVLQPDYYGSFRCLAGDCLDNCCRENWNIPLTKNEYMKLTGCRKSKDLEKRMKEGVKRVRRGEDDSQYAHILIGEGSPCRMLGEDGLCLLHKECGHEALGLICQSFPRSNLRMMGKRMRSCSAGCEGVVELFMKKKEGIRFQNVPLRPNERNMRYGNREIPTGMTEARPAPNDSGVDPAERYLLPDTGRDAESGEESHRPNLICQKKRGRRPRFFAFTGACGGSRTGQIPAEASAR